jgi:hypothetical protein
MSCFVCPPEHIGALGAIYQRMFGDDAALTAALLAQKNIRAAADRYPEDKDGERPGRLGRKDAEVLLQSIKWAQHYSKFGLPPFGKEDVANMVACYRYQAVEARDWRDSEAEAITRRIVEGLDQSPFPHRDTLMVEWVWDEDRPNT